MSESTPPVAADIIAPGLATPDPDPNSFSSRLEAARLNAGLSKAVTCRLLDISSGSYANYLKAVTTPDPGRQARMLKKLADYVARPPVAIGVQVSQETLETTELQDPTQFDGSPELSAEPHSGLTFQDLIDLASGQAKPVVPNPEYEEATPEAPAPPPPIKPVLGPETRRLVRFRP